MKERTKTDIEGDMISRRGNIVMTTTLRNVVIRRGDPRPKQPPSDSIFQYQMIVAGEEYPLRDLNECNLSRSCSS